MTGFSITVIAAALINILPYFRTRGAQHGDGFEIVGIPFTFWREGGISGLSEFHIAALLVDIALALVVALLIGCAWARLSERFKVAAK